MYKLTHVYDKIDPNLFGNSLDGFRVRDIVDQPNHNYKYDEIGQLISDQSEGIEKIEWRVDGKVKSILKQGETHPLIFYYDGLGNRVVKNAKDAGLGQVTHYARYAQGNVLATYRVDKSKLYIPSKNIISLEVAVWGCKPILNITNLKIPIVWWATNATNSQII